MSPQVGTSCPRCGGSMLDDCDSRGDFRYCLQCGYHIDLPESEDLPEEKQKRGAGTAYRRKLIL